MHAALSLLGTFLAVAGLFVLLHAEFLAAVQVLVYAGGIMVLFLFVIMLVNVARRSPDEPQYLRRLVPAAVVVGVLLAVLVGVGLLGALASGPPADAAALQPGRRGAARQHRGGRRGASTATTCCRSRSSRSCCWSR